MRNKVIERYPVERPPTPGVGRIFGMAEPLRVILTLRRSLLVSIDARKHSL